MIDKLKNKIKELKNDSLSIKQYVNCFCSNEKADELFKLNSDYKQLKNKIKK